MIEKRYSRSSFTEHDYVNRSSHASSRLCCPSSVGSVDWRNATSAPSYRRVSARWTIPSDCAPPPADLPKDAASFDLPIALGTLIGSGQVASELLTQYAIVGELALDGTTRPTKGALSMAISSAEDKGLRGLIVPAESAAEAAVVEGIEVVAVQSLAQAVAFLAGEIEIEPTPSRLDDLFRELANYNVDFSDVRGQEMAKRAIIVAAAGGHNLLMLWPITPA